MYDENEDTMAKRASKKDKAAKAVESPADRMMEVRPGRTLFWPDGELRGHAGYVVREDDPFISERLSVLRPARPGQEPNEVNDPKWRGKALEVGYDKFGTSVRPSAPPPKPIEHQPEPGDIPEADA